MKLKTKAFWLILLVCVHLFLPGRAQSLADNSLIQTAYDSAVSDYHNYLTPETHLFRGSEYVTYAQTLKEGYPYFGENSSRKGMIAYNKIIYNDVYLYYDLVTQQVIINDFYNVFKIALYNPLLDSFSIENHFFIHLRDSLNPTAPRNGFYERLYNGHIQLLKKEKKEIQEDLYSSNVAQHFIHGTDTAYYLKIGDVYHPVNNKRSLQNIFKDRRKELKKFIRTQQLSMRRNRENTLIKVTAWYDSLPR
ncbi:MAG TPA: hypothetical protein VGS79_00950 [Puia sp.]|nr:hypothetical protein [Puia sp.]